MGSFPLFTDSRICPAKGIPASRWLLITNDCTFLLSANRRSPYAFTAASVRSISSSIASA